MKRIFIFAAMAAISLTACQQELNIDENKPETHAVFTATTESSITKTALSQNGENYDVLWQNEDQITIVDAAAKVGVYQTASTTTQGSFSHVSGTAATTPGFKAWYPAKPVSRFLFYMAPFARIPGKCKLFLNLHWRSDSFSIPLPAFRRIIRNQNYKMTKLACIGDSITSTQMIAEYIFKERQRYDHTGIH